VHDERKPGLPSGLIVPSSDGQDASRCITSVLHQFAESLGNTIDAKDPHTSRHSDEVARIARVLALTMGLGRARADVIHVAGHLHDIGKIGVPDAVLCKSGPLTTTEWRAIRRHPEDGAAILQPVAALVSLGVVDMVLHHHERFDGKGYPHGLAGEAIPIGARIIALADTLSAMLQDRPYRGAGSFVAAKREVQWCSGTQFDPQVVDAFLRAEDEIRAIVEAERKIAAA